MQRVNYNVKWLPCNVLMVLKLIGSAFISPKHGTNWCSFLYLLEFSESFEEDSYICGSELQFLGGDIDLLAT